MIVSVKAILKFKKKYLMQLRDKKKDIFFANFWGFFGGQVDKKEDYKTAIKRELKEEINIKMKNFKKIFSFNYKISGIKSKFKTIYFTCEVKSLPKKVLISEGQAAKFLTYNEIKKINVVPWDLTAISYLEALKKKYIFPKNLK
tara:strand:+ start:159 stop:590 length:432 start_codon:yes stop_codon:yes gene_type:complete